MKRQRCFLLVTSWPASAPWLGEASRWAVLCPLVFERTTSSANMESSSCGGGSGSCGSSATMWPRSSWRRVISGCRRLLKQQEKKSEERLRPSEGLGLGSEVIAAQRKNFSSRNWRQTRRKEAQNGSCRRVLQRHYNPIFTLHSKNVDQVGSRY